MKPISIKVKVPTFKIKSEQVDQAILTATTDYIRDNHSSDISKMVLKHVEVLVEKTMMKQIKKTVDEAFKKFIAGEFVVESGSYHQEKMRFGDYFKRAFSDDRKYKFRDGKLERDSYGSPLVDTITAELMNKQLSDVIQQWIKDNEKTIKENLAAVVTNNVKKSIFGAQLPDEALMQLAKPKEAETDTLSNN